MVFSSIVFIFYFLPVFLLGYYLSGWRTGVLLAGSAAFYVWGEGGYLLLLAALIVANYAGALWMDRARSERARRAMLVGLILLDLGVLAVFKYAGFLAHNLDALLPGAPIPEVRLRLPLGISFFTFQLISYLADCYRGAVKPERGLTRFAAYILMFPHLIAGPIVRYADIRAEMHADRRGSGTVGLGLQYFIVGLCQKALIANTVAPVADYAFDGAGARLDAATAWLGAGAYALQIYFDFAGYSNMAIGLAFMLGFTYRKNFDYPYAARSITDFWRRWHISLSSWFRDYVYIPLGGNRRGPAVTVRNLVVVFLLTGLWHGAAWTFVLWGLYHGGFLLLERFGLARALAAGPRVVGHAYALLAVLFGWVLFRARDLHGALAYYAAMLDPAGLKAPAVGLQILLSNEVLAALAIGALLSFPLLPALLDRLRVPRLPGSAHIEPRLDTRSAHVLSSLVLLSGLALSVARLAGSNLNPFLYFRF